MNSNQNSQIRQQLDEGVDFKKKREKFAQEIRNNKREQIFNKRRNISQDPEASNNIDSTEKVGDGKDQYQNIVYLKNMEELKKIHEQDYDKNNLTQYVLALDEGLKKNLDQATLWQLIKIISAIRSIYNSQDQNRKLPSLTSQMSGPSGNESKIIALMVKVLSLSQPQSQSLLFTQLQLQALWSLANASYSEDKMCEKLINAGVLEIAIKFLKMNQLYSVDQAIVIIGNIAADDVKFRDKVIKMEVIPIFFQLLNQCKRKVTNDNIEWAITNLCRGEPKPKYSLVSSCIPYLVNFLFSHKVETPMKKSKIKVVSDILWSLSCLTEEKAQSMDIMMSYPTLLPLLMQYSLNESSDIFYPAFRLVGNYAMFKDQHTDALINAGFFDFALKLLIQSKRTIKREVCWILANIATGSTAQVSKFLKRTDLLDKLYSMVEGQTTEIKVQISWIFANFGKHGNSQQVFQVYQHYDIINFYVSLLSSTKSSELICVIFKCLTKVIDVANSFLVNNQNVLLKKFSQSKGMQILQKLQEHESGKVYKACIQFLKKYFEVAEDDS